MLSWEEGHLQGKNGALKSQKGMIINSKSTMIVPGCKRQKNGTLILLKRDSKGTACAWWKNNNNY